MQIQKPLPEIRFDKMRVLIKNVNVMNKLIKNLNSEYKRSTSNAPTKTS